MKIPMTTILKFTLRFGKRQPGILLSVAVSILLSGNTFSQSKVIQDGEQLEYVVSYGFIKIGEVNMQISGKKDENGHTIYYAKSKMKSYDGIPFVKLNSIFESDMLYDGKDLYSIRFKAIEYKENIVTTTEYKFNYDSGLVYIHKDNNGTIEKNETVNFNKDVKFQDGLSLFYQSRLNSFSSEKFLIPVFMNEAETSVNYFFAANKEEISVDSFDNDINSIRCSGNANFEGVFGLTGEFAGWFSDDDARVPLKSQLNVVIGNVTLDIKKWKRADWKLK